MEDKVRRYEKIEFLGEGQFATVFKARDSKTDTIVAVKKIKLGCRAEANDGINRTALREIKLLQELKHPNIIDLIDVFGHRSNVSLVFDFMDTDLEVIIKDTNIVLTPANVKAYILMTLQGLEYLHMNWILHRDLKPNNLLVNSSGILKLGDFWISKVFWFPNRVYTYHVVTRWYRSPELLFGAQNYGVGVDMWALGCILAELLLRVPFLPGDTDLDQLTRIFQTLGTPVENVWPNFVMHENKMDGTIIRFYQREDSNGMESLPHYVQFKPFPGTPLKDIFTAASNDLLELISRLLAINPLKRCTCQEALKMHYFKSKPYPSPGSQLPLPTSIRHQNNPEKPNLKGNLLITQMELHFPNV